MALIIFSWFGYIFHYTSGFSSSLFIFCSTILYSILIVEFKNKHEDKGKEARVGL